MEKANDNRIKELERLKEWSLTILAFIEEKVPQDASISVLGEFKVIVNQAYKAQNLRGIRMLAGDIADLAKELNKTQVNELNHNLIEKFGDDLNFNQKKIEAILLKGMIKNKSEYKLVFDYFEEIYSDESKKDKIHKVNQLLEAYQKKTGKV